MSDIVELQVPAQAEYLQLVRAIVGAAAATDPDMEDEDLWLNLHLLSLRHGHRLAVKAIVPKSDPVVPSMVEAHRAAHFHERECAEMFGITFDGNPDPRNILLPDDWEGHPLRKDYEFPKEYHGISCE